MKSSTLFTAITGLLIAAASCPPVAAQTCPPGIPRVAPDSRYIDHGDGTITDQQTGLMWKRCSEGLSGAACSGTPSAVTWPEALTAAADSSFAGHSDWRMPSVKELHSLVETGCHSPSINTNRFPNTPFEPPLLPGAFWTSTTEPAILGQAVQPDVFGVGFRNGGVGKAWKIKPSALLRLVRAGR